MRQQRVRLVWISAMNWCVYRLFSSPRVEIPTEGTDDEVRILLALVGT